jgi:NAD(P)H dehydrogenase (quinone)
VIVISGAGGKTGRAITEGLAARGERVRAWVHREAQAAELRTLGAAEVVVGDMGDGEAARAAVAGARAVYHICPNVHPDELAIGQRIMAAARAAGVERFVFHSVLHPQTEAMPHHWQKLRVEEALLASGLPFTILQPAPYMQNTLAYWDAARATGVFRVPYPVNTCLSLVDLQDVADAAARVLLQAGHEGASYQVVGTTGLTQTAVAEEIGRALGREVRAEAEPAAAWEQRARASGLGTYPVSALLAMFGYYEQFGLSSSPNVLTWLLGRRPTSYAEFARRTAARRVPEP